MDECKCLLLDVDIEWSWLIKPCCRYRKATAKAKTTGIVRLRREYK